MKVLYKACGTKYALRRAGYLSSFVGIDFQLWGEYS